MAMMQVFSALVLSLFLSSAHAIINGVEIKESEHPAVKMLAIGKNGVCTGTFIGPTTMVTATHCLISAMGMHGSTDGNDLSGLTVDGVRPLKYKIHPGYNFNASDKPASDIAVLEFPKTKTFPYVNVAKASPAKGDRVDLVGYGKASHEDLKSMKKKRKGSNVIFDPTDSQASSGQLSVYWGVGDEPKRGAPLTGDSGGPLFNADGELLGVANQGSREGVKMGNTQAYLGSYVDINADKNKDGKLEIREWLKQTVKELGGSSTSLFSTSSAPPVDQAGVKKTKPE